MVRAQRWRRGARAPEGMAAVEGRGAMEEERGRGSRESWLCREEQGSPQVE